MRAAWDLGVHAKIYIDTIHQLSDFGAVVTHSAHGTSPEGADFEWREVNLLTTDGERFSRCELFDEADLDAALAKFEQASPPARRLENAATRVCERLSACFAAREWDALAQILDDDVFTDDRRRVVGEGIRPGRGAVIAEISALADVGVKNSTSEFIATRGSHLVLRRFHTSGRDQRPEQFHVEVLDVIEINADERVAARVVFDPEDIDAAFEELDARYLAGEASTYARTWSLVAAAFAAINRHEFPELTPDWVNIDHRRGATFATGDMTAYLNDLLDDTPDINVYSEVVHRLSNLGAVITQVGHGTSQQGFQAEWREIGIFTFDGDLLSRYELFDAADLDTALAKFDELSRPSPQLENAASQVAERFLASFAARDWDAMAVLVADDFYSDDRRAVIGAGIRQGPDAVIAEMRANAELWITKGTFTTIATRGERLALIHARFSGSDEEPQAFLTETLGIGEINAAGRIVAIVTFDLDDFEAAIAELDARYIAGEAAAHARAWSAIARAYASISGRELAATTPDWVNIDHRRAAGFAPGEAIEYIRAAWDLTKNLNIYAEGVYRLNDLGAVVAHAARGTSLEGFDAEWRAVNLFTVEGDKISRTELFDEADVDAVIVKFEQLSRPAPQLENAASQAYRRFQECFAARDWNAMNEALADGVFHDDRRRMVGSGFRAGRNAVKAEMSALAEIGVKRITSDTIATRGGRLTLSRSRASGRDQRPDAFRTDVVNIVEIDADENIAALITFDSDEFDAAIAEFDNRYLAGEAAAHARTWSAVLRPYTAINRRELFATTPEWVNIDHRRGAAFAPGDANTYVRQSLDDGAGSIYVETVHRLDDLGAVAIWVANGTTQEGFDAEWRGIHVLTVDGELLNRFEVFDETDLDAALARFAELHPQTPRLENTASQVGQRYREHFAAGNWDAMADIIADDFIGDDRRRVVGSGVRIGRDAQIADMRAIADLFIANMTWTDIATRGDRLVLFRVGFVDRDQKPEAFRTEVLCILEIDAEERIVTSVSFDLDDIDAAFGELETRYVAGEAAAHRDAWSVISNAYAAMSRHELFATTPDWVKVDHRRPAILEKGGLNASLESLWKLVPNISFRIEAVHRLSSLGAVCTHAAHGVSQDGFDAEWRGIEVMTVDGHLVNRCEIFDEADLDAALARFEELHSPTQRLENAATRVLGRFFAYFGAHDWAAIAETLTDDSFVDDRNHMVNAGFWDGRDAVIANLQALEEAGTSITSTVIATRGERLGLILMRSPSGDPRYGEFDSELLIIVEINTEERVAAQVVFNCDATDAAFAELETRYVAGEAAAHAHTWSVITRAYAAINRHELPATTPDWVNIDHRRGIAFSAGDATAYLRASEDPQGSVHIETVHRLTDLGAVFTWAGHGNSQEGFEAEWRGINVITVEGDLIDCGEIFDETDLDAALARFEELQSQTPRLANAASQAWERFQVCLAAGDWPAMAAAAAEDIVTDDRRRVIGAGVQRGRDVNIASFRAAFEIGMENVRSTVIATRGERLVLDRIHYSGRDQAPEPFRSEILRVLEIDAEERLASAVFFDPDDIDAAYAELDARHLAGEAAAHRHAWSTITALYKGFNRRERPATTPGFIYLDHRPVIAIESSDLPASIDAYWDLTPDISIYTDTVHRLSDFGAVVTHTSRGISHEDFDAEWRMIAIFMVEGDLISRCEMFDEADLDAALARFAGLHAKAQRLENTASKVLERFLAHFALCEWDVMSKMLADNSFTDDRRRLMGVGPRHDREVIIAEWRAVADVGTKSVTATVVATRGERLALCRLRFSGRDQRSDAFHADVLGIVEINAVNRIAVSLMFDLDDIDAAFEELDARFGTGEAAAHAHTWSVIAGLYAGFNRQQLPGTTPDWIYIDHRSVINIEESELAAAIRAGWDLTPDIGIYMEAVHRLSDLGVVVTHTAHGISHEDVNVEWRMISIFTVDGNLISGHEMFDEADLDTALARFDELASSTRTSQGDAAL